jgi:hypothetical protein
MTLLGWYALAAIPLLMRIARHRFLQQRCFAVSPLWFRGALMIAMPVE